MIVQTPSCSELQRELSGAAKRTKNLELEKSRAHPQGSHTLLPAEPQVGRSSDPLQISEGEMATSPPVSLQGAVRSEVV